MEKTDICIIGAGVVGLAIAEDLSSQGMDVVVLEQHDGFGRETSSRNSEVIHGGMYYPENSMKARFCVEGNRKLYALCEKTGIPCKKIGKIIVAQNKNESEKIEQLYEQGVKNGIQGLLLLSGQEVNDLEPHITAGNGLLSPETGIIDSHRLMAYLERKAEEQGAIIAYSCTVMDLEKNGNGFLVSILDADNQETVMNAGIVINAAGLHADRIASYAGIDCDSVGYRIHPCKGEYFSVSNRHRGKISHLVYPAPTSISLGIHVVLGLQGAVRLGPNAYYVDALEYEVKVENQRSFFKGARQFFPEIVFDDLAPDMAGIRPKLHVEGEGFRDFIIAEESARGLSGLINLVGIESPGLTSCIPIAEYVRSLVRAV
jgi:L-2-hydroxyglutarate oxidase LhgO